MVDATVVSAAETDGLSCLPKHGGARDNKILVTHPMIDFCERCLNRLFSKEDVVVKKLTVK
jgi:hypothetical protein